MFMRKNVITLLYLKIPNLRVSLLDFFFNQAIDDRLQR